MSERLLDAAEVAAMLSVPLSWVRETTRAGAMPHVVLGRYRRYVEADVLAWLETVKQPGRPITLRRVEPRISSDRGIENTSAVHPQQAQPELVGVLPQVFCVVECVVIAKASRSESAELSFSSAASISSTVGRVS